MKKLDLSSDEAALFMAKKEQGRVVGCLGGRYEVRLPSKENVFCGARGNFRRDENRVLVGDFVELSVLPDGSAVISAVKERKNQLIRPLLANLDVLVIVVAEKEPSPLPELVDKLLAIAEHKGIRAALVVTKMDLSTESEEDVFLTDEYRLAGYPVFPLSVRTGVGVDDFSKWLWSELDGGATVSFAGASGVGKSTLLNAVFPELQQSTGAVSEKISRGRHTTRSVSLFSLGEGFVADTPGFSLLDFLRFDFFSLEDLPTVFPEVAACIGSCRYADCSHTAEEDCGVRRAVSEGRMGRSRYRSYCALYEILSKKKRDEYR